MIIKTIIIISFFLLGCLSQNFDYSTSSVNKNKLIPPNEHNNNKEEGIVKIKPMNYANDKSLNKTKKYTKNKPNEFVKEKKFIVVLNSNNIYDVENHIKNKLISKGINVFEEKYFSELKDQVFKSLIDEFPTGFNEFKWNDLIKLDCIKIIADLIIITEKEIYKNIIQKRVKLEVKAVKAVDNREKELTPITSNFERVNIPPGKIDDIIEGLVNSQIDKLFKSLNKYKNNSLLNNTFYLILRFISKNNIETLKRQFYAKDLFPTIIYKKDKNEKEYFTIVVKISTKDNLEKFKINVLKICEENNIKLFLEKEEPFLLLLKPQ